jgi:hypothetical protein
VTGFIDDKQRADTDVQAPAYNPIDIELPSPDLRDEEDDSDAAEDSWSARAFANESSRGEYIGKCEHAEAQKNTSEN